MAKNYTAHPIDPSTYVIEEKTKLNQALCYLICGEEKALLIDTGVGYPDLPETIQALTTLPVEVVNTHGHVDHIGGNHYFSHIWLHEKDRDIFRHHTDSSYTLNLLTEGMPRILKPILKFLMKDILHVDPSGTYHYFDDTTVFHLGNRDIEVIPTPGHTPGSVCLLDRKNKLLFSGDTICEQGILLHFKGEGCPPEVFLSSAERLIGLQDAFDTIWPGHHGYPVDKDYLAEYETCARQICDGTAAYKEVSGRKCACYGRIMISVPKE